VPELATEKSSLYDLTPPELESFFLSIGEPKYRSSQVLDFLYRVPVDSIEKFTTLPLSLRGKLAKVFTLAPIALRATLEAKDGAVKHVYELTTKAPDAALESVWMPSEPADLASSDKPTQPRYSLCVSTQLGCAEGCKFCATASLGLRRQLTTGQIIYQIVHCRTLYGNYPDTVLFMGMGEPMQNFQAVCAAVEILTHKDALGFSPTRIVISTAGELDKLEEFHTRFPKVRIAISLNAATDELRSTLMPINKRFNLKAIASFVRSMRLEKRQKITFEYVVLGGVNDTPEQIRALVNFLKPFSRRIKVNLIPFNPSVGINFQTPSKENVLKIQETLRNIGVMTFIRRPRGASASAACGQLAGKFWTSPNF